MLFNIVKDENFSKCKKVIENSLFPYEYEGRKIADKFKNPNKDKREEEIKKWIDKTGNLKLYKVVGGGKKPSKGGKMPFGINYRHLFITKGLASFTEKEITKTKSRSGLIKKCKNGGNYYHFINVISALARLIEYFSDPKHLNDVFKNVQNYSEPHGPSDIGTSECSFPQSGFLERLVYGSDSKYPNQRTFNLMLAGYYHDLGKTVVDHRHAREGYIILTDDNTELISQMKDIASCTKSEWNFDLDDIHFIATLVNFHDLFGTMSTGETGYLRAWSMIDRIKRYSLRNIHLGIKKQREWSERYLFDLWLLNVADIIVSIKDKVSKEGKWDEQTEWNEKGLATKKIERFFEVRKNDKRKRQCPSKADCLIHDLALCFRLLELHNKFHHAADTQQRRDTCYLYSRRHVVDRLQRFILEILQMHVSKQKKITGFTKTINNHILNGMTEEHLNAMIIRSTHALHSIQGFNRDFAWIGHMDYALDFFGKILDHAVKKVEEEIKIRKKILNFKAINKKNKKDLVNNLGTGWIRRGLFGGDNNSPFNDKMNALYFLYNFTSIVTQIIGFILNRESPLDRLRNLEFDDARGERLTEKKLDKINSLQGPYRTNRTRELILETVYLF